MTREVTETLQKICDIIRQSVPTERIYLFGSYAYGTPTQESDFDLFVVLPDASMRPMDAMVTMQSELYDKRVRMPIDILAAQSSRFRKRCQMNSFERMIERKGVLLYERTANEQRVD